MKEIIKKEIKKELSNTQFVSLIADETTYISNKVILIVVFKYQYKKNIKERCVGIIIISDDKTSENIFKEILLLINEYPIKDKLYF